MAAIGIGFGSDILRMTDRERDELVRVAVGASAGRKPVLAPVGGNSAHSAVERAVDTVRAGATYLMVTPPGAGASPTSDAIVDTYAAGRPGDG